MPEPENQRRHWTLWLGCIAALAVAASIAVMQFVAKTPKPADTPSAAVADTRPAWPYTIPDDVQPPRRPAGPYSLPGSERHYTQAQIDDLKAPPDWFPGSHPAASGPVVAGRAGTAWACGSCHLMSGMGHPESASLAGLPAAYIVRQVRDFQSGARAHRFIRDGKPVLDNVNGMTAVAKGWSGVDMQTTAAYFAALPARPWVKVVEATTVPRTYVSRTFLRLPTTGGAVEPLGDRIVELPQNIERQLLRDPASGTIAYVPVGSLARGRALVEQATTPCSSCHGPALKGNGEAPPIAGRSPLYLVRQLLAFKDGSRHGEMAALMTDQVKSLSERQMTDIAAYVASRGS